MNKDKSLSGCEVYLPTTTARSPLIVPGSDFCGSVAPISFRPYFITPSPSQTCRIQSISRSQIDVKQGDKSLSSSNHCNNRARAEEVAQTIEERSFLEIMIMLLGKVL